MRSRRAFALLAAVCAGGALWFSLGAVAVISDGSGFTRVGLLPPLWLLPVLIVSFAGLSTLAALSSRESLPLLLSLLLVLPWLPFGVPAAFLLWTADMTPAVWIAVAIGILAGRGVRAPAWFVDVRHAPRVAAAVALALYLFAGFRLAEFVPNGDEPHYLVITQSLLKDGDLQIENNHARVDYRDYFLGNLKPDYLRRGTNGQIYSIHAPGLPVAVAPAFALYGYHGVVIWLSLAAAFGSALLWRASYQLTGSSAAAWFGWATGALTVPFFFQSFSVYPDALAATLVLFAVMPLLAPPQPLLSVNRWLGIGCALAVLPWLHTRFAVLSGSLALVLLLRLLRLPEWRSRVAALFAVPAVSALAWFAFFRAIYGTFNPSAPYGQATQTAPANILNSLPALLFDQQFGILPYAPVYGVCLAGLGVLVRRRPRFGLELLAVAVPYLLVASMFYMWWAGTVSPARLAVPVLPLLALPGAWLWSNARRASRAMAATMLMLSIGITIFLLVVDAGRLAYNFRDGFSRAAEQISPLLDVPRGLPSFFRQRSAGAVVRGGIWLGLMYGAFLVLQAIDRKGRAHRAILAFAVPALTSIAIMIALTIVWKIDGVQAMTPEFSQLHLLSSYNPAPRPLGVQFSPFRIQSPEHAVSTLAISTPTRRPVPKRMLFVAAGVIPAGRYELRPKDGVLRGGGSGNAKLIIGDSTRPAITWNLSALSEGDGLEFNTSVDVRSIAVEADGPSVSSGSLVLHPRQLVSRKALVSTQAARRAQRYGPALVYFFDVATFPEEPGFWIRGGASSSVAVTSVAGAPLALFLRNAPVKNTVSLAIGEHQQILDLAPGEERTLLLQFSSDHATELIHLATETGFRPAEVEPGSTDQRFLGVWIEVRP